MTRIDWQPINHAEEFGAGAEASAEASATVLPQPADVEALLPELDAGNVVEEAEQLLRESAPHDFDVLVIGGGPGGLAAALRAAELGAHVGLVEARELGGTSLNRGCLPTKLFVESAHVLQTLQDARRFGIKGGAAPKIDLGAMQARKRDVIEGLHRTVSESLENRNVEIVSGQAKFVGKHTVQIATEAGSYRANAVHIVLATGSVPGLVSVPGADLPAVLSTDQLLELQTRPASLAIVGAGPIALEMACLFRALGADSIVLTDGAILPSIEDEEMKAAALELLQNGGLRFELGSQVKSFQATGDGLLVHHTVRDEKGAQKKELLVETVLLAQERLANTADLDLERAGIAHINGKIVVDTVCQTTVAGVYAIGDCIHGAGSAHLAAAEGILVAEHLMRQPFTVDLAYIPDCYYSDPEIACVGLTETQAKASGYKVRSGKAYFKDNQRALSQGHETGWAKVVTDVETRKLLGCQVIGNGATELINHVVLALKSGLTVDEFARTVFAHPSLSEVLASAALAAREATPGNDAIPPVN